MIPFYRIWKTSYFGQKNFGNFLFLFWIIFIYPHNRISKIPIHYLFGTLYRFKPYIFIFFYTFVCIFASTRWNLNNFYTHSLLQGQIYTALGSILPGRI